MPAKRPNTIWTFGAALLSDDVTPFALHLRSSKPLKRKRKVRFLNPSVACSLLGITSGEMLLSDLKSLDFFFESLCIRGLRAYARTFYGEVFHYRDYDKRGIDALVQTAQGDWGSFEIKFGKERVDGAAKKLLKIAGDIQKRGKKPPKVMCVIAGLGGLAYKRDDGVRVVPIGRLRE